MYVYKQEFKNGMHMYIQCTCLQYTLYFQALDSLKCLKCVYTSFKVGVRQVSLQEECLSWCEGHVIEEVADEAADIAGELRVEAQEQLTQQVPARLALCN